MDRARDISRAVAYVIFGYIFGFNSAHSDPDPITSFMHLLTLIIWALVIVLLFWFERTSQKRQFNNWDKIRSHGKWPFVISRYLLARSFVLLVILFLPFMIPLGPTSPLLVALAFAAVILCPLFIYIGHQEWLKNEREFLADPMIKAARARIAQSQQQ